MNKEEIINQIQSWNFKENPEFFLDPRYFEIFARYLINLPPSTHNILSIKKFVNEFGFPLLILFRYLYKKITEFDKELYNEALRYISSFVRIETDNLYFEELQFFHIVEGNKKNNKPRQKNLRERCFLDLAFQLSKVYGKLNKFKLTRQNWSEVEELKNKFIFIDASRYFSLTYFQEIYLNQLKTLFNDQYYWLSKKKKQMAIETQLLSLEFEGISLLPPKEKNIEENFLQFSSFQMGQPDQIFQQIRQPTQLIMCQQSNIPLCCRTFFVFGQFLPIPKRSLIQMRNYIFPFTTKTEEQILSILCSFLNEGGGTLLIGILDQKAQGQTMNESLRGSAIEWIIQIRKRFYPQLTRTRLDFIPVKVKTNGSYIPGHFVMRINAVPDMLDDLFSYRNQNEKEVFYGRQKNKVVLLQGRKLIEAFQDAPYKKVNFHEGVCQVPEKGIFLYNSEITFQSFGMCTNSFLVMGYNDKEIFEALSSIGVRKSINVFSKGNKNCFLKIEDESSFSIIYRLLKKMNDINGKKVFPVFKNLEITKKNWETIAKEQLSEYNFVFCTKRLSKSLVLKFKNKVEACSAFLLLKESQVPIYFTFI